MISVVINADTRPGWRESVFTVGDRGQGSLQGCRSIDFLFEGVRNKMDFFRGYKTQCILCIDEHETIPHSEMMEISQLVHSYGNESSISIGSHDRTRFRWYDYITIEALRKAEGEYIVHFDADANAARRRDDCNIVDSYFCWLKSNEYEFICQPSDLTYEQHKMYWASTRFFICKRESLHLDDIESCLDNEYLFSKYGGRHYSPHPCCLEHTLGIIAGHGRVLYPPREDDQYLVWNWSRYYEGTLKWINESSYNDVRRYIVDGCGLCGPNDVVGRLIL